MLRATLERMPASRRSLLCVLGVVAGAATAACAHDFDALFADGPVDASANVDAGSTETGAAAEAGAEAGGCGTPSACSPQAACAGGTCTYTCECGCTCAPFACPQTGTSRCETKCAPGTSCDTDCDVDGACVAVIDDANAKIECKEHADSCNVQCGARSSCDVRCDNEGPCSVTCGDDAQCVLRCTARPSSCTLTCDEGQRTDCGNGVFTCQPSCPSP